MTFGLCFFLGQPDLYPIFWMLKQNYLMISHDSFSYIINLYLTKAIQCHSKSNCNFKIRAILFRDLLSDISLQMDHLHILVSAKYNIFFLKFVILIITLQMIYPLQFPFHKPLILSTLLHVCMRVLHPSTTASLP